MNPKSATKSRHFHPFALVAILALATFLGACHQRKVIVLEPLMPKMDSVATGLTIQLSKVEDGREVTESIGDLRNGFGKVMGHIYADKPVDEMFTKQFLGLLKKAGYQAGLATPGGSKTAVLNASIATMEVRFSGATMDAKVIMDLELIRSGKKLLTKTLEGFQLRMAMFIVTTGTFEKVMNEALDNFMDQMAEWVSSKEFQKAVKGK